MIDIVPRTTHGNNTQHKKRSFLSLCLYIRARIWGFPLDVSPQFYSYISLDKIRSHEETFVDNQYFDYNGVFTGIYHDYIVHFKYVHYIVS